MRYDYRSVLQERGDVLFPANLGERVYMREIRKGALPDDLARWQPTVDAMLDGIDVDGPLYLMIDQGLVEQGKTQRRPGLHIDGYWNPTLRAHSGEFGGHGYEPPPVYKPHGGHSYMPPPNSPLSTGIPAKEPAIDRDTPHGDNVGDWAGSYSAPEAILLASDVSACQALVGDWDGWIMNGGAVHVITRSTIQRKQLEAFRCYAGNVTMLHESMPMLHRGARTLVRINVPGWTP